jgi:hypothetical protein
MNTQPTPISDRIVSQFRKGEATSDGLILTMEKLERERDEARAEMIRWQSIAEGRGRTDDEDIGKAMSNLIRQRDEARTELSEWRILNGWGGTPEIIHDFIKGQQTRIHHAQDLEAELAAVTAQRDRLTEALQTITITGSAQYCREIADDALQSLTPNAKP